MTRSDDATDPFDAPGEAVELIQRDLKKGVGAVHSTGMGFLQRKLFNVLLLQAYDDLLEKPQHEIPMGVLRAMLRYDSKDYVRLRQALRDIRSQAVELNLLSRDTEQPPWTITGLISEATIDGGVCTYSFGPKMAQSLYNPEIYALINLRIQNEFTSSFTLNLYENAVRFRGTGTTGWIPVDTWRKLLGATAEGYKDYKRFRRRVLAAAIKECNEKSDLVLTLEEQRAHSMGRPVTHLRFLVKENSQRTLLPYPVDRHDAIREQEEYQQLRSLGVSDRLALMSVSEDPKFATAVARLVSAEHRRGKVRSPAAYASKLLRDKIDLTQRQIEMAGLHEAPGSKVAVPAAHPAVTDADANSAIKRAFEDDRKKRAMDSLTPGERLEWIRRWAALMQSEGRGFLLQGCQVAVGELSPVAEAAFQRHVAREKFGEATPEEMMRWVARRVAG